MNESENKSHEEIEPSLLTAYLSEDRKYLTVFIDDEISNDSLNPIINFINQANEQAGTGSEDLSPELSEITHINLFVNSEGGDLIATTKLLAAMDTSNIPIRTIASGTVASAGLVIFMAGHERLIGKYTTVMSHNASFMTTGNQMNHVNDKSTEGMKKVINSVMTSAYLNYTKKPIRYIKRHLLKSTKDDVYMSASDTFKHGFADDYFMNYDQLRNCPTQHTTKE